MKLIVNGEELEFKDGITLLEVIKELKIEDKVMAVAVNLEVVKKDNWDKTKLKQICIF